MVRRNERCRGYGGVLVDNARLDETLNCLYGGSIDDAAQSANSVRAVYDIAAHRGVLHDGGCDHDDIVSGASELLDDQIHHLAERRILVLEKLRDTKKQRCGFLASPALAREEEQCELGEDHSTLSW